VPSPDVPQHAADAQPWWQGAFRSDYRALYPHRDLDSARTEAAYLTEHGVVGRVLDLACGFGRHSLALSESGSNVVGLDWSMDLLRASADLPGGEKLRGRLLRGDARALPLRAEAFDTVVNLFSSFGYFGAEGDARVAAEISRVLVSGGLAILDLMNPERIRSSLVPESRTERDGIVLTERRALAEEGRRVTKEVLLERPGHDPRSWREDVRMYDSDQIAELFATHGVSLLAVRGDFGGAAFDSGSERQIVHLRKD
jgi:SAM-dependent methyltransferase